MSNFRWIVAFPLNSAWLCVNCDAVSNQPDQCPACAGHQLLSLANILDRKKPDEPKEPAS